MFACVYCSEPTVVPQRGVMISNQCLLQAWRPPSEIEFWPICSGLHVVITISWLETWTCFQRCSYLLLWLSPSLLSLSVLPRHEVKIKLRGGWLGNKSVEPFWCSPPLPPPKQCGTNYCSSNQSCIFMHCCNKHPFKVEQRKARATCPS